MMLDTPKLQAMTRRALAADRAEAFVRSFAGLAPPFGADRPWRLPHFLAQVLHESADLRYAKEVWGPTPAQRRYEGRRDLGNTQPGDGAKFRGYGYLQVTGRANTTEFRDWCAANDLTVPDFAETPERIAEAPYNVLSALWYWDTRGLNRYADANDIENLSVRVNGGYNGYADRLDRYARCALVLLGYGVDEGERRRFQFNHDLDVDGRIGPKSRMALHAALKEIEA